MPDDADEQDDDAEDTTSEGYLQGWPKDAEGDYADPQVWERQQDPLTVRWLLLALATVSPDTPVEVSIYDGSRTTDYQPVDITIDHRAEPPRLVITATRLSPTT
jgi:hypothetical protein